MVFTMELSKNSLGAPSSLLAGMPSSLVTNPSFHRTPCSLKSTQCTLSAHEAPWMAGPIPFLFASPSSYKHGASLMGQAPVQGLSQERGRSLPAKDARVLPQQLVEVLACQAGRLQPAQHPPGLVRLHPQQQRMLPD